MSWELHTVKGMSALGAKTSETDSSLMLYNKSDCTKKPELYIEWFAHTFVSLKTDGVVLSCDMCARKMRYIAKEIKMHEKIAVASN